MAQLGWVTELRLAIPLWVTDVQGQRIWFSEVAAKSLGYGVMMRKFKKWISPPWSPDVMFKIGVTQAIIWTLNVPLVLFLQPQLGESIKYVVCVSLAANILGALSWMQSALVEKRQMVMQKQMDEN
jgi:hypothetical protein